jgi:hypothetical protein
MSIADAICPATLIQQEPEETLTPEGDNTHRNAVLRRGQSVRKSVFFFACVGNVVVNQSR